MLGVGVQRLFQLASHMGSVTQYQWQYRVDGMHKASCGVSITTDPVVFSLANQFNQLYGRCGPIGKDVLTAL